MLKCRRTLVSLAASAALLFSSSCARNYQPVTETTTDVPVVSSVPPFQTKEPERYRATRITTTIAPGGETVVTRNSIARDGDMRREEVESAPQRVVFLHLPEGRFVLLPQEKLFAVVSREESDVGPQSDLDTAPDRLLHTEPLTTAYQKLGMESAGGRNAQKYRVVVNTSTDASVSGTETLIWIDEALHIPIRSETSSPDGTRVFIELTDITLEVDPGLFRLPDDFEKITFAELRRRLKKV